MNRRRLAVLALPALVYAGFLVLPLFVMGELGLHEYSRSQGITTAVSLRTYWEVLSAEFYLSLWISTIEMALVAALCTTILGTVVAFAMWLRGGRLRSYLTILVLAPLFVNGVARAYGWIAVIGPSGAVSRLSESLGGGAIHLLYRESAVILGFTHVLLPFVVIAVISKLDTIRPSYLRASAASGATPTKTVLHVIAPIAAPSVVGAFVLAFALASASYAVPAVLGGGRVPTIAGQIVLEQTTSFDLPRASALAVMLLLGTLAVLVLSNIGIRLVARGFARLRRPRTAEAVMA